MMQKVVLEGTGRKAISKDTRRRERRGRDRKSIRRRGVFEDEIYRFVRRIRPGEQSADRGRGDSRFGRRTAPGRPGCPRRYSSAFRSRCSNICTCRTICRWRRNISCCWRERRRKIRERFGGRHAGSSRGAAGDGGGECGFFGSECEAKSGAGTRDSRTAIGRSMLCKRRCAKRYRRHASTQPREASDCRRRGIGPGSAVMGQIRGATESAGQRNGGSGRGARRNRSAIIRGQDCARRGRSRAGRRTRTGSGRQRSWRGSSLRRRERTWPRGRGSPCSSGDRVKILTTEDTEEHRVMRFSNLIPVFPCVPLRLSPSGLTR